MIRLIFMVIALLMMVGAIIGGLYFWGVDPLAKFNVLVGNAPAPIDKAESKPPAPPSYVEFGLLIVPVVQDREVKKQAEMILRLQVAADKKELVAQNLPRLQNAFLSDMMAYLPYQLRNSPKLDEAAAGRRVSAGWVEVLGAGLVLDVTIEQASVK